MPNIYPILVADYPRKIVDEVQEQKAGEDRPLRLIELTGVEIILDLESRYTAQEIAERSGLNSEVVAKYIRRPIFSTVLDIAVHTFQNEFQFKRADLLTAHAQELSRPREGYTDDFDEILGKWGEAYERVANPAAAFTIVESGLLGLERRDIWFAEAVAINQAVNLFAYANQRKNLPNFAMPVLGDVTDADRAGEPMNIADAVRSVLYK